ncbi:nucleotide exchange factor GrpE [Candidatus Gracilibacteria bacterium]|nr:nucleotide exchange factor GrpE [Candidatus Gracilibacteria bacterium]
MTTQDSNNINQDESTIAEEIEAIVENVTDDTENLGKNPPAMDVSEQISSLQSSLARSQADYQNLLMRVERDKADMAFFLSSKMLTPLLTQIDNLERAVKLKEGVEGDGFVDGIRSVLAGFQKFLESQGVTSFVSVGQEVDPDRHDVMTEMAGEAGVIVSEFEKGYLLRDRVLRHAKVIVGNGN